MAKIQQMPMDKFELIKCKVLETKGIDVKFGIAGESATYSKDSHELPHEDLVKLLESLRPIVAEIFFMKPGAFILNLGSENSVNTFDPKKNQKLILEQYDSDMIDRITVTGVALSGSAEKMGAVITSVFESKQGGVAINTKRIMFNGTKLGVEEELSETCEEIRKEIYQFLYNDKKQEDGQMTMFTEGDESSSSEGSLDNSQD